MFKEAPCFIEVPFGCSDRYAQYLPDLFMFKAFEYKQVKYECCVAGQLLQQPHYVVGGKPVVYIRVYRVVICYYFQGLVIEFCLPAAMVDTGIDYDAPDPSHQIAPAFVLVYGIEDFQHALIVE